MPRELKITEKNLEGFKTIYDDFQINPTYYQQHARSTEFLKVVELYQKRLDAQKPPELEPYKTPDKFLPDFMQPEPKQDIYRIGEGLEKIKSQPRFDSVINDIIVDAVEPDTALTMIESQKDSIFSILPQIADFESKLNSFDQKYDEIIKTKAAAEQSEEGVERYNNKLEKINEEYDNLYKEYEKVTGNYKETTGRLNKNIDLYNDKIEAAQELEWINFSGGAEPSPAAGLSFPAGHPPQKKPKAIMRQATSEEMEIIDDKDQQEVIEILHKHNEIREKMRPSYEKWLQLTLKPEMSEEEIQEAHQIAFGLALKDAQEDGIISPQWYRVLGDILTGAISFPGNKHARILHEAEQLATDASKYGRMASQIFGALATLIPIGKIIGAKAGFKAHSLTYKSQQLARLIDKVGKVGISATRAKRIIQAASASATTFGTHAALREVLTPDHSVPEKALGIMASAGFGVGLGTITGGIYSGIVGVPAEAAYGYLVTKLSGGSQEDSLINSAIFTLFALSHRRGLRVSEKQVVYAEMRFLMEEGLKTKADVEGVKYTNPMIRRTANDLTNKIIDQFKITNPKTGEAIDNPEYSIKNLEHFTRGIFKEIEKQLAGKAVSMEEPIKQISEGAKQKTKPEVKTDEGKKTEKVVEPIVEPVIEKPAKKEVKPPTKEDIGEKIEKPTEVKPELKKPEIAEKPVKSDIEKQEIALLAEYLTFKNNAPTTVEDIEGAPSKELERMKTDYLEKAKLWEKTEKAPEKPKKVEKPVEKPKAPKKEEPPAERKPSGKKAIIEPTVKADKQFFTDIYKDIESQIDISLKVSNTKDIFDAGKNLVFDIKSGENFTVADNKINIETEKGEYEFAIPKNKVELKDLKSSITEAFKKEQPIKAKTGISKRTPVLESLKVLQDKTAPPARVETAKAFLREKGIGFRGKNVFGESSGYSDTGGYTDVGGYFNKENKTLRAVALPELVGIAKDLVGGKVPVIKKRLRGAKGTALGAMIAYGEGKIELRADIFENSDTAAKVLAHEIGHIVDYLPEQTMKRGNILGRIASLKKHMKPLLEGTEFKNKEIIEELRQLTQIWKPDSPIKGYTSKELYADAISVLFNDPALLKKAAPKFNEAFFNYLGRKPAFKFTYESIQKAIEDGSVKETRQKDIEEMIDEGEKKQRELEKEERAGFGDMMNAIKKELVDHNASLIKMIKKDIKDGKQIKSEDNPIFWAEELPYISSETNQYLRDVVNKIKNPAKKAGLSNKDIGIYMFLYRVATERGKLANPKGYTPTEAVEQLDLMHRKLGDVKFNQLTDLAKDFNELRQERVISLLEKSGMYDQGLIDLIKTNDGYATFQVQEYMENKYGRGVARVIMPQIGTFKDIANPFAATLIKDQSIIYATNVTEIKKKLVDWLSKDHSEEISKADTKFVVIEKGKGYHQPLPSKNPKEGMITYLQGGKVVSYYVPKDIAETFERDPFDAGLVVRFGEKLTRPLKEIFVGRNPFWMLWNIQRDTKAWAKQLPGGTLPKMIKYLWKSKGDTFKDVFLNKSTKDVADMYRNKMLIIDRQWRSLEISPEDQIDRILQDVATDEVKHHNFVVKPIIKFWELLSDVGKYSERIVKISGYKYLSDLAINEKEIAHLVRKRSGSPDFLAGGTHRRLYNTLFLFSNAGVQGIRGAYEAAVENPASYAYKTFKYDLLPKVLMYYVSVVGAALAAAGLISDEKEDELKLVMDRIPDRDKENYVCVPIGLTETGKAVYFIIPHDFQGQVIGGLFWDLLNTKKPDDIRNLVDYMSGQLPYSSLNPLLGESAKWISYLSKKNPYNRWTGRNVLSDDAFAALPKDSKYAREEMWKDTWNSLGGSVVHRFKTDNYGEIQSELEKILDIPIASGFFRRFVRVSNWGEREKYKEVAAEVRADKAIERLEFKPVLRKMVVGDELSPEEMQILANNIDWLVTKKGEPTQNLFKFIGKGSANAFIAEYMSAMSNDEKIAIMQKYIELSPKK